MHDAPDSPSAFLNGPRIAPGGIRKGLTASDLLDEAFLAYNAGRLHDGARLLAQKVLKPDVTVGLTLT